MSVASGARALPARLASAAIAPVLVGSLLLGVTLWFGVDWICRWSPPEPIDATAAEVRRSVLGRQLVVQVRGEHGATGKAMGYALRREITPQAERVLARWLDGGWAPMRAKLGALELAGMHPHLTASEARELAGLGQGGFAVAPELMPSVMLAAAFQHTFESAPSIAGALVAVGADAGVGRRAHLAHNLGGVHGAAPVVLAVQPSDGHGYVAVGPPGLMGVLTGINRAGLALAVNPAPVEQAPWSGMPVSMLARRALREASTVDRAVRVLLATPSTSKAVVGLVDATGRAAVLELGPGGHSLRADHLLAATDALATDRGGAPHRRSLGGGGPRRRRIEALLRGANGTPWGPNELLQVLRDRRAHGGESLPLAHGHAVDALAAGQSVIIDAAARRLWVAEGPSTLGAYRTYDVDALLAGAAPGGPSAHDLPPDALLPTFDLIERARSAWGAAENALERGDIDDARDVLQHTAVLADHPRTLVLRGRLAQSQGELTWAAEFYRQALLAPPETAAQADEVRRRLESVGPLPAEREP